MRISDVAKSTFTINKLFCSDEASSVEKGNKCGKQLAMINY